MCQVFCTLQEISYAFGCSEDTLELRCKEKTGLKFTEFYKKHSGKGKMSLRRAQYKLALEGNATMQIWLGKNILKQRDAPEDIDQTNIAQPVSINFVRQDAHQRSGQ
ncbi:MAG: hypothetical protein QME78_13130 [Thermodesulfobacteriota bacterium]|nr:hypothetical protein [Thermodesulfobacteriota bacterium]